MECIIKIFEEKEPMNQLEWYFHHVRAPEMLFKS